MDTICGEHFWRNFCSPLCKHNGVTASGDCFQFGGWVRKELTTEEDVCGWTCRRDFSFFFSLSHNGNLVVPVGHSLHTQTLAGREVIHWIVWVWGVEKAEAATGSFFTPTVFLFFLPCAKFSRLKGRTRKSIVEETLQKRTLFCSSGLTLCRYCTVYTLHALFEYVSNWLLH